MLSPISAEQNNKIALRIFTNNLEWMEGFVGMVGQSQLGAIYCLVSDSEGQVANWVLEIAPEAKENDIDTWAIAQQLFSLLESQQEVK